MARFDPDYTRSYYDRYGDRESARWKSGPRSRMQHEIYSHHLRTRVGAGAHVLDAGCGPGTFTSLLLQLGARVVCLDLSPVQLAMCRAAAPGAESYELGSITDLSRFQDAAFDITLALGGPLSYCFEQAPEAVRELTRVTKPGGLVGLSAMSLAGTIHRFLPEVLKTPIDINRQILSTGDLPRVGSLAGHECHMFRPEELRQLLSSALESVELFASGWLVLDENACVPAEGSDEWRWLLEAELVASQESPGAGTHMIAWATAPRNKRTTASGE